MAAALPDFPAFDINCEPTSLGISWKKWSSRLENLFVALDIKDEARKKALLLHYGGEQLSDIFATLEEEADVSYKLTKVKLDAYFEPKVNLTYETYNFRMLCQEEGESIDKFVTRLRESAARCKFHDPSREIKDQVVQKCNSDKLRRRALREDPSLDSLLKCARAMELSDAQAAVMEGDKAKIDRVRKPGKYSGANKSESEGSQKKKGESKRESDKLCYSCGESFPHKGGKKNCPAFGVKCDRCGKHNHLEKLCKKKKIEAVEEESSDSDDDSYTWAVREDESINKVKRKKVETRTTIYINDIPITEQIDSGADVNTITESD